MIDLIPARPWMADDIELHDQQAISRASLSRSSIAMAVEGGMALAAVHQGKIIGMAGIYDRWEGCGLAWALFSSSLEQHRFGVFKLLKRALDTTPLSRVEAYVVEDHAAGHNLLLHLGFEKEGVMRKFWQDRDHALYAKVR